MQTANHRFLLLGATLALTFLGPTTGFAGSATWKSSPATGDWNTATNWTPQTVPNGASDIASFATSNQTDVSISADTQVDDIVYNKGATAFTIKVLPRGIGGSRGNILTVNDGIINNSALTQSFVMKGSRSAGLPIIEFQGTATAGSATAFTVTVGEIDFYGASTAADASFTLNPATGLNVSGGIVQFLDGSAAANARFIVNGSAANAEAGQVIFFSSRRDAIPSAGNANFTLNAASGSGGHGAAVAFEGGGATAANATFVANGSTTSDIVGPTEIVFFAKTTAGNAVLTANGGSNSGVGGLIEFLHGSDGGTARVAVFGNGNLDVSRVSDQNPPGALTIGSIEGDGKVFLGATQLTIGSNALSTTFSGAIQDNGGASNGTGGSLIKIGQGKLTLTGANTYSGGTSIKSGKLLVNNSNGSGTGTGAVFVNGGQLGGNGTIAGAVTVGNGKGRSAFLTPGASFTTPGRLTIQNPLTFNSDATYKIQINSSAATADRVVASGVTINTGAQFVLEDLNSATLPAGTVFTIMNNIAGSAIAGTFANLPDKSIFTIGANTFKANYEGGDGNDLTLTVQ